jgi:hypothetical protein
MIREILSADSGSCHLVSEADVKKNQIIAESQDRSESLVLDRIRPSPLEMSVSTRATVHIRVHMNAGN